MKTHIIKRCIACDRQYSKEDFSTDKDFHKFLMSSLCKDCDVDLNSHLEELSIAEDLDWIEDYVQSQKEIKKIEKNTKVFRKSTDK